MGKHIKRKIKSIKKKVVKQHEQNYVVALNVPIHKDLYDVVDVLIKKNNYTDSVKNNIWLAVSYIDKRLKNRNSFVPVRLKDIIDASNKLSPKIIRETFDGIKKYFKYHLLNGSKFEINWKYSYENRKCRSYKLAVNRDKEYEYLTLRMKNNTVYSWKIGERKYYLDKLDSIKDHCWQQLMFVEKEDDKVNIYADVEKNYRGYHQGLNVIESTIENRFRDNIFLDVTYLKKQIFNMFKDNKIDVSIGEQVNNIIESVENKTFTYSHGRIYCNGFHNCSKEYRDKIWCYDDSRLVQLFDVKSCFWLFSFLLYSKDTKKDNEWGKLYDLIINQDLYTKVQNTLHLGSRDEAKQILIKWLFSNSIDKRYRRNINKFFKNNFPKFYEWLINREQVIDENGNKKNTLSVQCQWLESDLIKELFEDVKELKTVTLHDSIWISKDQYSAELKNMVEQKWNKIIKENIKQENNYEQTDGRMQQII